MNKNVENSCRTCMRMIKKDARSLLDVLSINVFSRNGINERQIKLGDIIGAFTCYEISAGDNLPQQICLQCEGRLIDSYTFQQLCYKSNAVFREIIESQLIDSPMAPADVTHSSMLEAAPSNENFSNLDRNEKMIDLSIKIEPPASCEDILNPSEVVRDNTIKSESLPIKKEVEDVFIKIETPSDPPASSVSCKESLDIFPQHMPIKKEVEDVSNMIIETTPICVEDSDEGETVRSNVLCEEDSVECSTFSEDCTEQSKLNPSPSARRTRYRCPICGFITHISVEKLKEHMKVHDESYVCEIYDTDCQTAENISIHTSTHKSYVCNICRIDCKTLQNLLTHKRSHIETVKCIQCKKIFKGPGMLKLHMEVHKRTVDGTSKKLPHIHNSSYICNICDKDCQSAGSLSSHMRSHTSHFCNVCRMDCETSQNLLTHKRCHSGANNVRCRICGKIFKGPGMLKLHMESHKKTVVRKPIRTEITCKMCKQVFINSESLKLHMESHNRTVDSLYTCNICDTDCQTADKLSIHFRSHQPFFCNVCVFDCKTAKNLATHKRCHSKSNVKKPTEAVTCNICKKVFDGPAILQLHIMDSHKTPIVRRRTHVCPICGKGFNSSFFLDQHTRGHSKPLKLERFICKLCKAGFNTNKRLLDHMKFHKKIFRCALCVESFASRQELANHIDYHRYYKSLAYQQVDASIVQTSKL